MIHAIANSISRGVGVAAAVLGDGIVSVAKIPRFSTSRKFIDSDEPRPAGAEPYVCENLRRLKPDSLPLSVTIDTPDIFTDLRA